MDAPSLSDRSPSNSASSSQSAIATAIADAVARLRAPDAPQGPLAHDQSRAIAVIYDAYAPMLLSVARRFVGPDDAADVVHDVFYRLPRTIAQYRGDGLGGWLKQCVVRTALMRLRAARRHEAPPAVLDDWSAISDRAVAPHALGYQETCDELSWALAQIPESLRGVVVLRVFADATHQEIAERLGITPSASEVRLCRALKQLRGLLRPSFALADTATATREKASDGAAHHRPHDRLAPATRRSARRAPARAFA